MLPFTKRPGRDEGDAKDAPLSVPPASNIKRSVPPPSMPPPGAPGASALALQAQTHSSLNSSLVNSRLPLESGEHEEDEMTSILQSRSMTGPILPAAGRPIPAAGRPATIPPSSRSRPASMRPPPASHAPASVRPPPPSSQRGAQANQDDEDAEDDDGGRTVVRGAPKIVKRTNKNALSPAAVIKATMESARSRRELLPGPPSDLLDNDSNDDYSSEHRQRAHDDIDREDQRAFDSDRNGAGPSSALASESSEEFDRDQADFTENIPARPPEPQINLLNPVFSRNAPVMSFEGPPSHRPPAMGTHQMAPVMATERSNMNGMMGQDRMGPMSLEGPPSYPPPAYGSPPSSRPNAGMQSNYPAHYNNPNVSAAQSGGHAQIPMAPGSMPAHFMTPQAPYQDPPGTAVTNGIRIAGRPAMSWAAALLACGLFVGVAAVAIMQSSDSVADTTASFVDPSRTGAAAKAPAANPSAPAPTPVPMTPNGTPVPAVADQNGGNGNPPGLIGASPVTAAPPPVADPAAAPGALANVGTQPVASAPVVTAPGTVVAGFAPVPVPTTKKAAPAWRAPAAAPPKSGGSGKTAALSGGDEDPPKKGADKPKPGKKGEPDDETKKALEALQKAQLESASSFGDK